MNDSKAIVRLTLISEGILLCIALPWFLSSRSSYALRVTTEDIIHGLITAVVLLILSYLLDQLKLSALEDFRDNVVLPLVTNLRARDALIIALASGVAEEMLFRGLIQEELSRLFGLGWSLFLTNFAFAYIHIMGSVKRYLPLLYIYFGAGVIFSLITIYTENLFPAMLAHAIFNFTSILWLKTRIYCS